MCRFELCSDVYILVVEEVLGEAHDGFGFFDLGFDFLVLV